MLRNRTILVTGAESGIGRAIALECAAQGARIAAVGLVAEALEETASTIRAGGGEAVALVADIASEEAVRDAFGRCLAHYGRLEGVVANAGIVHPPTPAVDITPEVWRRVIEVNLTGAFLTVAEAARVLVGQGGGGSIIATGSSTAIRAMPGLAAYAAAKAGVHMLMQTLALELGRHRIRVNTLVPGTTASPLTRSIPGHLERIARELPLGEVTEAAELAAYVAFVLGDAMPHMTGSLLKIDSGRTIA